MTRHPVGKIFTKKQNTSEMKNLLIFISLSFFLFSCTSDTAKTPERQLAVKKSKEGKTDVEMNEKIKNSTFFHESKKKFYGYYFPEKPIKINSIVLYHFFMGENMEFDKFEKDPNSFAPIHFNFNDTKSKLLTNELGQEYYETTYRVGPVSYFAGPDKINFTGKDEKLGNIKFTGKMNWKLRETETIDKPVLTGDLMVGDELFKNIQFTWFAGD